MCDSLVVLPVRTQNEHLIIAKNSDREPLEAQSLIHVKRKNHSDTEVRCTYISIPQVAETYEVILSKPFQMWGAEMGVNEFGVAIANEAVFTNVKINKSNKGLTGMDLLRLALERSKNADEALSCITGLLQEFGQDACGGYQNKNFFYHNAFIIADAEKACVLETAGKSYAVKSAGAIQTISNGLSIEDDYDRLHLVREKRIFPFGKVSGGKHKLNFRKTFTDFLYSTLGRYQFRKACAFSALSQTGEKIKASDVMEVLKIHHLPDPDFTPRKASTADICMHATGLLNPSDTTGSMVAEIRRDKPSTIWLTGTNMPCLSVFIPFFMGTEVVQTMLEPGENSDQSLWWQANQLHRWVCEDYQNRKTAIQSAFKAMQLSFVKEEQKLIASDASLQQLEAFSKKCLDEVMEKYRSLR
jgi:dipeptidase